MVHRDNNTWARCHMGRDCSPWICCLLLTIEESRILFSFTKLLRLHRYWRLIAFNNYPCTRRGQSAGFYLTYPVCKTSTLQALYFIGIVKMWNNLCNKAFPSGFTSLSCFKSSLKNLCKSLLMNVFDVDKVFSWLISPECSCHQLTIYIYMYIFYFSFIYSIF